MFFLKNTNNISEIKEKLQALTSNHLIIFLNNTGKISDNKEKGQVP